MILRLLRDQLLNQTNQEGATANHNILYTSYIIYKCVYIHMYFLLSTDFYIVHVTHYLSVTKKKARADFQDKKLFQYLKIAPSTSKGKKFPFISSITFPDITM